jgi:hypothetical protein
VGNGGFGKDLSKARKMDQLKNCSVTVPNVFSVSEGKALKIHEP